jgi:hypothetical protein
MPPPEEADQSLAQDGQRSKVLLEVLKGGFGFRGPLHGPVSWYFEDSSHRDGLTEGLVGEQRRVRLEIG